jgi:hypothetical protein
MKSAKDLVEGTPILANEKDHFSDEEINELAEWLGDLTIKQTFFLKDSYESFLKMEAMNYGGHGYIQ